MINTPTIYVFKNIYLHLHIRIFEMDNRILMRSIYCTQWKLFMGHTTSNVLKTPNLFEIITHILLQF